MSQMNKSKWKQFGYNATEYSLPPIFAYLIELYDGKDVLIGLESCRINPDYASEKYLRNDLEYYIPQLTNFVVFHEEFLNNKLTSFLEDASKANPYFAHCYYWYINSLLSAIGKEKAQRILDNITETCSPEPQAQLFQVCYEKFYALLQKKWPKEVYEAQMKDFENKKIQTQDIVKRYKTGNLDLSVEFFKIKAVGIDLKSYVSPFLKADAAITVPFTSTIVFLEDLYTLAEEILKKKITDKVGHIKSSLQAVNKALPSCVYIPFVKDSLRHYAILNIVVDETRVFSTKERAPFYLCVEIFRPQEELSYEHDEIFQIQQVQRKRNKLMSMVKKAFRFQPQGSFGTRKELDDQFRVSKLDEILSSPMTLRKMQGKPDDMSDVSELSEDLQRAPSKTMVVHSNRSFLEFTPPEETARTIKKKYSGRLSIPNRLSEVRKTSAEEIEIIEDDGISIAYQEEPNSVMTGDPMSKVPRSERTTIAKTAKDSIKIEMRLSISLNEPLNKDEKEEKKKPVVEKVAADALRANSVLSEEEALDFFGEDSRDQARRIKENSPFKHLKSWRLVHLIVKTGADMKEEQFAIQLISQFDQIFRDENLKLILTPYEILSLGNDFGILEAVKDAITMSRLKEKMYRQNIPTLNIFFDRYYGDEADRARRRFCRSLAAYSLVCYFLQIKDRHNGNILFHKQGHILHIDFGFLFTNAPGKGLEFEKKVPFKLTNEYVEVLGGPRSSLFQEFRKLFYRGFMAARKHREQILILVKMMYSTQGANLPCFRAGNRAIIELEQRFCPPGVHEKDLNQYCYNLINQSLDNWRAKCYDKYQYHFQGIFY